MKIIVVSHPDRSAMIDQLIKHIPVELVVIDSVSALSGHRTALECAAAIHERVVIMEDDAIPVVDFCGRAEEWFHRFPDDLLSFYLGTSRPVSWQSVVDIMLSNSERDFIQLGQLIHGVCYSLPIGGPTKVLAQGLIQPEADFAIGSAWRQGVVYPIESLVEHRDTTPVERHPDGQPRVERRAARRLAGPLMYSP